LHTHFVQTFLYLFFFFSFLLQRLGFDFGIDVMLLVFFWKSSLYRNWKQPDIGLDDRIATILLHLYLLNTMV